MFLFRKAIILISYCLFLISSFVPVSFAQTVTPGTQSTGNVKAAESGIGTLGVARLVVTNEKDVKDGSLLSSTTNGNVLTTKPYDSQIVGVVSRDAAISILDASISSAVPVISTGTVYILVSSQAGNIKKGDYLASSTLPGVAVKAVHDGYILGTALEDYSNPDPKKVDKIAVDLNLHYFNSKPTLFGTLTDIIKIALFPTKDSPTPLFKYVVAAIVVLGSFVLAFMTFGRTAAKGVEALGRNPSASKIIHLGIIFNVTIVVVIVLAGLTVAFFIIRL